MNTIVGRDRELDTIAAFLELADGTSRALLIEGEAGVGKTTLWRAGIEAALGRGHRVLATAGAASESSLSFTALRDLVGDVFDGVADELPAPQRRALEIVLLRDEAGAEPPRPETIAVAFFETLRLLARRSPVLLAIDDVQWLDPASASPIEYTLRRLGAVTGLHVVLSLRTEDDRSRPLALDDLEADTLQVLRPRSLSIGALGRILNSRLGAAYPRSTLRRLHEVSDGNPFFALELARALGDPEQPLTPGTALPVPRTLKELLTTRLRALPDRTLEVLTFASALSRPTLRVVGSALGYGVGAQLDPAIEAQIAAVEGETIRFAHPLFAATVYALAGPAQRLTIHRRLAGAVRDVEERARHLALATEEPDEDVAQTVEEGAKTAFARGAPSAAAELLALALRVTPSRPNDRILHRKAELARYHLVARNLREAAALFEEIVAELPAGTKRAGMLLKLARAREQDSIDAARQLAEAALVDAGGDGATVAPIECYLAGLFFVQGRPREAVQHSLAALRAAERAADDGLLTDALTSLAWLETLGLVERAPRTLERALALDDQTIRPIYSVPDLLLGVRLMYEGRLDEGRERLQLVGERALATGDEAVRSGILVHLTDLECRAGNWEVAARHVAELAEQHQALSGLQWGRALVAAHRGDVAGARAAAERGIELAERAGFPFFRALNASVLGFLELSIGDDAAADRILRPLAARSHAWVRDPGVLTELPNAIEALVGLGDLAEAKRLLAELDERLSSVESPWGVASAERCRGLILAAEGELDAALAAYERAMLVHDRLPQPFDRARTLLALGTAQRRARKRAAARETLGAALAIFENLGAKLWAAKARAELARIAGRGPASGDLTPSERRIAELVTEGKTNKEVAAILVIADRTVESALTQIYRKLDVRSRTELARKLAGPG